MRVLERPFDEDERSAQPPTGAGASGGNLNARRQEAQALLAAGDDAINRALSTNSEEFLQANRQEGGQ